MFNATAAPTEERPALKAIGSKKAPTRITDGDGQTRIDNSAMIVPKPKKAEVGVRIIFVMGYKKMVSALSDLRTFESAMTMLIVDMRLKYSLPAYNIELWTAKIPSNRLDEDTNPIRKVKSRLGNTTFLPVMRKISIVMIPAR